MLEGIGEALLTDGRFAAVIADIRGDERRAVMHEQVLIGDKLFTLRQRADDAETAIMRDLIIDGREFHRRAHPFGEYEPIIHNETREVNEEETP